MNGKSLLAKLLGTSSGLAAVSVASQAPGLSAEQTEAGTAEMERLVAAAYDEGQAAGVTAERERFGAVLTDPAAADNMGLAITLLSTTANTPEQIGTALAAVAKPAAAPAPAAPAPNSTAATTAAQTVADDPLKTADPIGATTPLVDLGNGGGTEANEGAPDTTKLWDASLTREANSITAGGFALAGFQPAPAR